MLLTSNPSLASTVDDSAFLLTDERMWIAPFMDRERVKGGGGSCGRENNKKYHHMYGFPNK